MTNRIDIASASKEIIEDGVSQGSIYGLPSIGGAISTRYKNTNFNHNIENNGSSRNAK